jgi:hypothetical protein
MDLKDYTSKIKTRFDKHLREYKRNLHQPVQKTKKESATTTTRQHQLIGAPSPHEGRTLLRLKA